MNTKSLLKKTSRLILIGLFVSLICYPLLHELGHVFATILVGGNVKQMTLFPVPSVLCELTETTHQKLIFTGLSGVMLPAVFSIIYTPKHFSLWYANLMMKLISVYSMCLDCIYAMLFFAGTPVANNDITVILSQNRNNIFIIIIAYGFVLSFLFATIKKSAPFSKTMTYFN